MSNDYSGIKFTSLDIDKQDQAGQELGVRSLPTFYFFFEGNVVTQFSGADGGLLKRSLQSLDEL